MSVVRPDELAFPPVPPRRADSLWLTIPPAESSAGGEKDLTSGGDWLGGKQACTLRRSGWNAEAAASQYTGGMRFSVALMLVAVGAVGTGAGGCAHPEAAVGFDEADPAARLRAVREAGRAGDRRSGGTERALVEMLDSDDPAERMLAQLALERLTGQTLGYDHAAGEAERREAVRRWVEWCREREAGAGGDAER